MRLSVLPAAAIIVLVLPSFAAGDQRLTLGRPLHCAQEVFSRRGPRDARDHPSVLAMLGVLPGRDIDRVAMRRSFDWVWANWPWDGPWGWDGAPPRHAPGAPADGSWTVRRDGLRRRP